MASATKVFAGFGALASRLARAKPQIARPDSLIIISSSLFDYGFYLRHHRDVEEAGVDALDHFQTYGWREGRRPNPYFDPLWYRDHYLDAGSTTINPLVHYIEGGEAAGCKPIATFDPTWYRRAYGVPKRDLALAHYLGHRRRQRFAPNPDFDVAAYVALHGREIGPNRDPFEHFLRHAGQHDPAS